MYSAASVIANAFSNSQSWDAVRQYAFLPGDANVDSWLSVNRELDKKLNADEYAQEWTAPNSHVQLVNKGPYTVSINEHEMKIPSAKLTADEIVAKYKAAKEAHISKKDKAVESEFGDITEQNGASASGPEISE